MATSMRPSTLQTLGLGSALEIFSKGRLPVSAGDLVDRIFGGAPDRGALVISGANGVVGAGKAMQLASRLLPYGVPVVALDLPGSPDGIGKQVPGLERAFGREVASRIMEQVVRLAYDGKKLPSALVKFNPRFLLEAVPEILELKKEHYRVFRERFPEIEIRSVTSGFPASQLGVGIAHPAFPHEINKVWEVVEPEPSPSTQLLWALGLLPVPVSDHWSFVLDVLFCGLTLTGLRYHEASNMPFWKIDKYIRRLLGPNPFRAHDAIGAQGANFLTWSCLHHLHRHYGPLFEPTAALEEHRISGANWYPLNHFRPLVNWTLGEAEEEELNTWILGPLFQMTSLVLHENRGHLAHVNAVGELCAQFRRGVLALARSLGAEAVLRRVHDYHALHPAAAQKAWHPAAFERLDTPEGRQLYVNAETDGKVGLITLGRESYNSDVDAELNRAVDWLKERKIEQVILSGDFHLSTQLVGADTTEFFPALEQEEKGYEIAATWSRTARRLFKEFRVSVGFIHGKRCLGGMLELITHCTYLVCLEDSELGLPEVSLPVVPGMEGCHWPFRKAQASDRPRLLRFLLEGKPVKGQDARGWLVDFAGPLEDCLKTCWNLVQGEKGHLPQRRLETGPVKDLPGDPGTLSQADDAQWAAARKAILDNVHASLSVSLEEALEIQARRSAAFMTHRACRNGAIGGAFAKTMTV